MSTRGEDDRPTHARYHGQRKHRGDLCLRCFHYRQALALADKLGLRPLVAHCHRGLGMLYGTLGQQEPACRERSTTIELYRAMDMTFWLPQAEAALTQVEGQ
jgi:hypothetical protein